MTNLQVLSPFQTEMCYRYGDLITKITREKLSHDTYSITKITREKLNSLELRRANNV
jgi:hypothetical protein